MNWTGGRLCRSRNANSSVSAKQKNHFAKVRANLQSTHSSPKRPPFDFGHWRPEYETTRPSPSASSQHHGHSQRQTILDDFENVRPLVKKLQTLNQLNDSHKRKRPVMEHRVQHSKTEDSGGKATYPIVISSRPSSASSAHSSAPAVATNEDPSRFDSLGTSGPTSIEAKRRRLLQMEDWVGVERRHSKPAHMTFTEAEDRDMIGKRRQTKKSHYVTRDVTHRSSERKPYLEQPMQRNISSQDFGVSQMSIRIGSAVDRSQASVSSGEMLFDSEVQERDQRRLQAAPVIQPGELGSLPLSDQTQREIRASPDFMDDLSSGAAVLQPEETRPLSQSVLRHRDVDTPSGSVGKSTSFDFLSQLSGENPPKYGGFGVQLIDDDSETNQEREPSTPLELERAQEEQSFRLVFENTPQPPGSNRTDSEPIVRDFAYPNIGPPLAQLEIPPLSQAHHISIPDSDAEADDSSVESLAIRPRSFRNTKNHIPGNNASTGRAQHTERPDKFGGDGDPAANSESSQASSEEGQYPARRKSLNKDKVQLNPEEESIWRSFTMIDEMEDTNSFKARPTSDTTGKEPTTNQHLSYNAQLPTPTTKPRSPIDEEEQIWRAFIFSDDDNNSPTNEWTLESPSPLIQSPAPSNPTRTQPSMVAEASTSPLKQNPHLHEASLPVSPSQTSGMTKQGFSKPLDSATSHSSDILAEVSSPTEDPLGFPARGPAQLETAGPSDEESTMMQRPRGYTFTPWTALSLAESIESQTERHPHSSLSAQPPTTISSSPQPPILSSDPLHGPFPRPVAIPLKPEHTKIIFTPPMRYVGPRVVEPEKRITLGRGVRGGKRVGGKTKGRGKGKGVGGAADGEGDEIVDE